MCVPVAVEDRWGVTTDVSSSGVRFETDRFFPAGSQIAFSLALRNHGSEGLIRCEGQVVRVDEFRERAFIAATIDQIRFDYELR